MQAKIKFTDKMRGFGFLVTADGDLYFHRTASPDFDILQKGDDVTYRTAPSHSCGNTVAIDVRRVTAVRFGEAA